MSSRLTTSGPEATVSNDDSTNNSSDSVDNSVVRQRRYRSENNVHALFAQLDALMNEQEAGAHNPYNLPAPVYRGTTPATGGGEGTVGPSTIPTNASAAALAVRQRRQQQMAKRNAMEKGDNVENGVVFVKPKPAEEGPLHVSDGGEQSTSQRASALSFLRSRTLAPPCVSSSDDSLLMSGTASSLSMTSDTCTSKKKLAPMREVLAVGAQVLLTEPYAYSKELGGGLAPDGQQIMAGGYSKNNTNKHAAINAGAGVAPTPSHLPPMQHHIHPHVGKPLPQSAPDTFVAGGAHGKNINSGSMYNYNSNNAGGGTDGNTQFTNHTTRKVGPSGSSKSGGGFTTDDLPDDMNQLSVNIGAPFSPPPTSNIAGRIGPGGALGGEAVVGGVRSKAVNSAEESWRLRPPGSTSSSGQNDEKKQQQQQQQMRTAPTEKRNVSEVSVSLCDNQSFQQLVVAPPSSTGLMEGIPSSAHGRLFPRHALATPGTPLNVLMMKALRQEEEERKENKRGARLRAATEGPSTGAGTAALTEEEIEALRDTLVSEGYFVGDAEADAATLSMWIAEGAYETLQILREYSPQSATSRERGDDAEMGDEEGGGSGSRAGRFSHSDSMFISRREVISPSIIGEEDDDDEDEDEDPSGPAARRRRAPPPATATVIFANDSAAPSSSHSHTSAMAASRTNSRVGMRLTEASQLDSELQTAMRTMETTRRQREMEREQRRAARRARAAKGIAGFEEDGGDEAEEGEEAVEQEEQSANEGSSPLAETNHNDDDDDADNNYKTTHNDVKKKSEGRSPPKSPRTLHHEQFRAAMARAETEDRVEFEEEELREWNRLLKDAETSVEAATIVFESRRRAELKRLQMHLASDDSREREKRRIFEFVRDCLFDEEHSRPEVEREETRERSSIVDLFSSILRSDAFQCQVDERLNRLELFDFLEDEERRVLYEFFVENAERVGRRVIEAQWFEGIAGPYKATQDAQGRDEVLLQEAIVRVDLEDEEAVDRFVLREMYVADLIPLIDRDSWKVVTAEAEARLRIEREEPSAFLALITNPEDDTPFERSRVMVRWYTQTVSRARKEWIEHLNAKIKVCSDGELSGRLFVQQEQREEWIWIQETFRRDGELRQAEVQRREEFEARVALAEEERRREAEERLAQQGVAMPPKLEGGEDSSAAKEKGKGKPKATSAPSTNVGKKASSGGVGGKAPTPATPSKAKTNVPATGCKRAPSAGTSGKKAPSPAPKRTPSAASRSGAREEEKDTKK